MTFRPFPPTMIGIRGDWSPLGRLIAPSTEAYVPRKVARPGPNIRVMISRWSRSAPSRSPIVGKP